MSEVEQDGDSGSEQGAQDQADRQAEEQRLREELKHAFEERNRIIREGSDELGRDGAKSAEEAGGLKGAYWKKPDGLLSDDSLTDEERSGQHAGLYKSETERYEEAESRVKDELAKQDQCIRELRERLERLRD